MKPIDPSMSPEDIRAHIESLTPEEKRLLLQAAFAAIGQVSFDLLSAHQLAVSNGRKMPNETDLEMALSSSSSTHLH